MATEARDFAPAKLNLYLHVLGRRPDGYHELDSLVAFAATHDALSVQPAEELSLTVTGAFAGALSSEPDNLVLRAARALAAAAGIVPRAQLVLDKQLPVASGIGGGSADAAAALRLLTRFWNIAADAGDLLALAATLGADVPVCLAGRPARMGGTGAVLNPAPVVPECGVVLVNPGVAVATPAVFAARVGDFSRAAALPDGWPDAASMAVALGACGNDLEAPARALCPPIDAVLAALRDQPGCLLARMSGSGATCFGLFADAAIARARAAALGRPGWWCWGGALRGS